MNTTPSQSVSLKIFLIAFSLLWTFGSFYQAEADTSVSSNIDQDATWVASSSPYIIQGDVTIATGATLTIGAGTIVKFAGQNSLRVNGSLKVNGTAGGRVYFTSLNDDAVGGDTNGSGPAPKAEDWRSVIFLAGSTGSLNYATIRYSGYAVGGPDVAPAIYNQGGTVTVDNSAISDGYLFGLGQTAGSLNVSNSTINVNGFGVGIKGGGVELVGNIIDSSMGIIDDGDNDLKLTNNTIRNSDGAAVMFYLNKQRSIVQSGNAITGNRYNGIALRSPVTSTFRLSASELPYVVMGGGGSDEGMGQLTFSGQSLSVATGGVLNVDPGVAIKFTPAANLAVSGTVNAIGTTEAPIVFTSIFDDSDGSNTWDIDSTTPANGDWSDIRTSSGGKLFIEHALLRYGGRSQGGSGAMLFNQGGTIDVRYSTIKDSEGIGIKHLAGATTLRNNDITNHSNYGAIYEGAAGGNIDAINNYWGSATGPSHSTNPGGSGTMVSDNVLFKPFLTAPYGTATTSDCCSSVLFLPGIMSTRLYEGNTKRWEPGLFGGDNDVKRLYLNEDGKSVNTISVGEVIGTFDGPASFNKDLYKSFLADLAEKKTKGVIADYSAYSYDWRLSLRDILSDGKLEDKLRQLAASSTTGKVTIVAHSNGGLLAKALINELSKDGDAAELVDNIVFVGVPQLGTPQAIGTLLHGYDSGLPYNWLPIIYSPERARNFARNTPSTYNLLPHSDYYHGVGSTISTPLATFGDGSATKSFVDTYGYDINNHNELRRFLRGDDKRATSTYSDLINPAKSNDKLFLQSLSEIDAIDSSWQAPVGIKLYQIAGVGELTLAGIQYKTFKLCIEVVQAASGWYCKTGRNVLGYSPVRVYDGDETVVEPSALAMPVSGNIERWWVNLGGYNASDLANETGRAVHNNLLQMFDIRSFIFDNVIGTSTSQNFTHLSTTKPQLGEVKRLSFTLHSPLSLSYTESDGTVVDEQNPYGQHSRYVRFGEVQLIDVFDGEEGDVNMQGLSRGSFSLEIEEVNDGTIVSSTTFSAIPSVASTSVSMIVDGGSISDLDDLVVDYNNDKEPDISLEVSTRTVVTLPTIPTPSPVIKTQIVKLQKVINTNITDRVAKQDLKKRASNLLALYNNWEKAAATSKTNFAMKIRIEVNTMEKQIVKYQKTKKIKRGAAANLNRLLKSIKKSL